ncbi:hypothetical protein VTI74DRAFT_11080 [Chaetomium olivicolor]
MGPPTCRPARSPRTLHPPSHQPHPSADPTLLQHVEVLLLVPVHHLGLFRDLGVRSIGKLVTLLHAHGFVGGRHSICLPFREHWLNRHLPLLHLRVSADQRVGSSTSLPGPKESQTPVHRSVACARRSPSQPRCLMSSQTPVPPPTLSTPSPSRSGTPKRPTRVPQRA